MSFKTGGTIIIKKWIVIIESVILGAGFAVAEASFASSDDSEFRGGTIRIENQAESDFPAMSKIIQDKADDEDHESGNHNGDSGS